MVQMCETMCELVFLSLAMHGQAPTKQYMGRNMKYSSLRSEVQSVPRLAFVFIHGDKRTKTDRTTDMQTYNWTDSGTNT